MAGNYRVNTQVEFSPIASATTREVFLQKALAGSPKTYTAGRMGSLTAISSGTISPTVSAQDYVTLAIGGVLRIAVASGAAVNLTNAQLEITPA